MIDKHLYTLIALSATDFVGTNRLRIIQQKFSDISDFLNISPKDQMQLLGLKTEKSETILINMKRNTDKILEICHAKKINFIPYNHASYPKQLKEIIDPPYLLYSQGILNSTIPMIAVIGTRKSTPDAEKINQWFCKEFAHYGIGVVSGLAQGHDAIAAETILKYDGYSVGVLGTAIDSIYPKSSYRLINKLKEHGCILSEYPPGMASTKWRFPRRNRIVSGLSQALCVIQAPEKSGTMITVNMAVDQGKDVFVIPGNPMIPQYNGTNNLIQKGAKILLHPQDIIQEILKSNPNLETIQFIAENHAPEIKINNYQIIIETLTEDEKSIFDLTATHTHIDEIIRELDLNIATITSILTLMELKGLIVQKPGQIYIQSDLS